MKLKFKEKQGLIPAIIQDYSSKEILMLGYMNNKSFEKTVQTGWVYFWSRFRKQIWMKGETSGNKLKVKEIYTDCDKDSLLIKVDLVGSNVCHTGNKNCFYTNLSIEDYESK